MENLDDALSDAKATLFIAKILSNTINQAIMNVIDNSKLQSLTVDEITIALRKSRVDISKRLKKMKDIKLLKSSRYGRFNYYSINYIWLNKYELLFSEINKTSK